MSVLRDPRVHLRRAPDLTGLLQAAARESGGSNLDATGASLRSHMLLSFQGPPPLGAGAPPGRTPHEAMKKASPGEASDFGLRSAAPMP
jgi:hypothetical protein